MITQVARARILASVMFLFALHTNSASQTGTLQSQPVDIGHADVNFHFQWNATTQTVDVDITDIAAGHSYLHRGAHLWELELLDSMYVSPPVPHPVLTPSDCAPTITWVKTLVGTTQTLTLTWTQCAQPAVMQSDVVSSVALSLILRRGAKVAAWHLDAVSGAPAMTRWSIMRGAFGLSIVEDLGLSPEYYLLMPIDLLTKNPATNLLGPPKTQVDFDGRPIYQLTAYYDISGRGLYIAGADETGDYQRNVRFSNATSPSRVNIKIDHYDVDVDDPGHDFTIPYPTYIGRFSGDWYDAAVIYRNWLESSTIASQGLLATRTDISDDVKRMQEQIVLTPREEYDLTPTDPTDKTVVDRLIDYKNNWHFSHMPVLQFGVEWTTDGCAGPGVYAMSATAIANAQMAQAAGLPYYLYLFDNFYATDTPALPPATGCTPPPVCCPFESITHQSTYATEGWQSSTIAFESSLDGTPDYYTKFWPCAAWGPGAAQESALICPTTMQWKNRIRSVGQALATNTIDGVYIDNMFPVPFEYCYSASHPHSPGFGSYMTAGLGDTFVEAKLGAAIAIPGKPFDTFSEVNPEGYIRRSSILGSSAVFTSFFLTGTANGTTTNVPVISTLYHHLVGPGPAWAGPFAVQDSCDPVPTDPCGSCLGSSIPQKNSVFSSNPTEQDNGRRGAAYVFAYSWANGAAIWSFDIAAAAGGKTKNCSSTCVPGDLPFSFDLGSQHTDYNAVCKYASTLALIRGLGSAYQFLGIGKRMRDMSIVSPSPMPMIGVPLAPTDPHGLAEVRTVPKVVQGVWDDPQSGDIGIALANHSLDDFVGSGGIQLQFNTADYGLSPTTTYNTYIVTPNVTFTGTDHTLLVGGTFMGTSVTLPKVDVLKENYVVLRITSMTL